MANSQKSKKSGKVKNELNEIADEALKVVCQYFSISDMKALHRTDHPMTSRENSMPEKIKLHRKHLEQFSTTK
ncbi:hypothetical protein L3Y34_016470 [Caenorhabditis briggsae]|uniref:Uncharacterized protein n=1 Tax=Caenorhabditis briggsae TaxID=6238 RepID=A0AAE9E071_CAEBR|nr:hypothetical protein L3Y34_016470 [Caenorhabditis briggsae]